MQDSSVCSGSTLAPGFCFTRVSDFAYTFSLENQESKHQTVKSVCLKEMKNAGLGTHITAAGTSEHFRVMKTFQRWITVMITQPKKVLKGVTMSAYNG